MVIQFLNPTDLLSTPMYAQVSAATGSRIIHTAGQQAVDAHGNKIGSGDLAAQTEQAVLNVASALKAADATFDDVAKLTIYVTEWTMDKIPAFVEGFTRAAQRVNITRTPPTSVIGVSVLFDPDFLIEIEAVAVLP